ncbi:hypothetical protein FH972_013443 [Carpinus fangiana]|uniref:Uncharacterized protein n=1 Tax=Carpinus fangiana TaxID=176857 RepID=A0A5N6R996_9ROSI|nr:hypothetical protein FH972_013443 [Carpinus fangiana]
MYWNKDFPPNGATKRDPSFSNKLNRYAPLYQTLSARLATTAPSLRRNWRERRQPPAAVHSLSPATPRNPPLNTRKTARVHLHQPPLTAPDHGAAPLPNSEKAQLLHGLGTGNPLAAMAHSTL